jgi:DNA polymerase elongation subunit (family B)
MQAHYNQRVRPDGPITMKIIEWYNTDDSVDSDDSDDSGSQGIEEYYTMRCFGVTEKSESITCNITGYKPYYYVKVSDINDKKVHAFLSFIKSQYTVKKWSNLLVQKECGIVRKKDMYGFNNGKVYTFIKLVFNSYSAMMRSRYIFKNPVCIPGINSKPVKFKLYESNFEPFIRFCHQSDTLLAGWITIDKYAITTGANTQIDITTDYKNIKALPNKYDQGNFLQASWDIEVYSHDGTFPSPHVAQNVIFQIATVYKHVKDDTCINHLLTLKKCAKIDAPNTIVTECASEYDLIKAFADTIHKMDPDIMYTYNGDSFDCVYLTERAKKHGLEKYLYSKLSRIDQPCKMKKEFFSSSAYGDSEYFRLYIPGRLNYDLLIHYKRGLKKYSSYKLDYIAEQVLGQRKHEVSVKDIFGFYKDGDPEKIKVIGEYCIQDCALLQRLADHHLILESNTQLANVTFVPISYLLTKGQTIKVFSQILRMASRMGFLVPHTNFNTDTHSITILLKDAMSYKQDCAGGDAFVQLHIQGLPRPIHGRIVNVSESGKQIDIMTDTELTDANKECKVVYLGMSFKGNAFNSDESAIDGFTGATVLKAIPGIYKDNIAVLDFMSLYPTIMISRNLCFSTFVLDEKYKNIENVNYERISWDDSVSYKLTSKCTAIGKTGKSQGVVCGKQAFFETATGTFCRIHDPEKKTRSKDEKFQNTNVSYDFTIVQPHIEDGVKKNVGVVPALLEELYNTRKLVKRQMNEAYKRGDKHLGNVLNSNQAAIKVSLNSTYGFLGRNRGNLVMKELGSIVTSVGRTLIEQSKEYSEEKFTRYLQENNHLDYIVEPIDISCMSVLEKNRFLSASKK